jgi:hypothetical protein
MCSSLSAVYKQIGVQIGKNIGSTKAELVTDWLHHLPLEWLKKWIETFLFVYY